MTSETIQMHSCDNKYKCSSCLKSIGIIGLLVNAVLAVLKIVVGVAFFSTALLADALYSILDIGYSVLVVVGLKISAKPPDSNHDYGHGKVEFIITIAFAVLTVICAIALFVFALFELHDGVMGSFSVYVVLVALISAIGNYLLYNFTKCIAVQFKSPSVASLSIHSKADVIASLLVAVSTVFIYFGYHHAGPFVAIVETAHILLIGIEIFKTSMYGLLDASIPQEDIRGVKSILNSTHGIKNVNYVKSRKVGQKIWLNVEIELSGSLNISEVDEIRSNLTSSIKRKMHNIEDIMVNVLPFREKEERKMAAVGS